MKPTSPMDAIRIEYGFSRKQLAYLIGKGIDTVDGYLANRPPIATRKAAENLTVKLQSARDTADKRLSDIGAKKPNSVSLRVVSLALVAKHNSPDVDLTLSNDELTLFTILGE